MPVPEERRLQQGFCRIRGVESAYKQEVKVSREKETENARQITNKLMCNEEPH